MTRLHSLLTAVTFSLASPAFSATLYVPLHDHYLNDRITQLAVLVEAPTLRRPYNIGLVQDWLPKIADTYPGLHRQISSRLERYQQDGLTRAELTLVANDAPTDPTPMPNARGETTNSRYRLFAQAHWHATEWFAGSAALQAREDPNEVIPVDTYMSVGNETLQLDLGYRERWLSPMQHSAMLLSTNARPFLSAGISNPAPVENWWNLQFEVFLGRLERMQNIRNGSLIEAGSPLLLGTHLSFEPLTGWTIGLTRTIQFGGGSRDTGFGDVWDAFIDPVSNDNPDGDDCVEPNTDECEVGNQQAAISSRIHFSGDTPFSVYFEYAGEDTASFSNTRLGNLAVSAGIYIPFLFDGNWSFNFEFSEWQNGWYTHDIYLDGYTNDGVVMGHWGGSERQFGSSAGANTQSIALGWQLNRSERMEFEYHRIENEDYASFDYHIGEWLSAKLSSKWQDHSIGVNVGVGNDIYGNSFKRIELEIGW